MEVEGGARSDINYLIVMKHVCKFCHKRFPCGRSLGGHMRSHLIINPSDHESTHKEKVNTTMEKKKEKKNQLISSPATTAGEFSSEANSKKKLSDQDPNQMKCCKECGKAFHSSKALSGHMKSHAVEREKEKEKERQRQRQREKESSILSDQVEKTPKQQVMDGESDNEAAEAAPKSNFRPRRAIRRQRYMGATSANTNSSYNNNNGGSSSVSEIDQQEQEDVAMCLIMLSRDVGPWGGVNGELSDNNSVFLEPKNLTGVAEKTGENRGLKLFKWVGESSTCEDLKVEGLVADEFLASGYKKFLEKMKSSEGSGAELGSKSVLIQPELGPKRKAKTEAMESEKRSKFECTTCNKTFHSYQALGGHRASHKKAKGCSSSNPEGTQTGETKEITDDVSVPLHNNQGKGINGGAHMIHKHECPICFKEFPSGQALGGHKRSHLMATSTPAKLETKFASFEKSNATTVTTTSTSTSSHEVRDFLDLNLPAPVEEEASNGHHQQQQIELVGFKPWWVESTHKLEQLVGLISN